MINGICYYVCTRDHGVCTESLRRRTNRANCPLHNGVEVLASISTTRKGVTASHREYNPSTVYRGGAASVCPWLRYPSANRYLELAAGSPVQALPWNVDGGCDWRVPDRAPGFPAS